MQTGRSRGFCFIYYRHLADAEVARDQCCGLEVDGRRIRVAYSITERPHTPTPGVYRGRSTKYYKFPSYERHIIDFFFILEVCPSVIVRKIAVAPHHLTGAVNGIAMNAAVVAPIHHVRICLAKLNVHPHNYLNYYFRSPSLLRSNYFPSY